MGGHGFKRVAGSDSDSTLITVVGAHAQSVLEVVLKTVEACPSQSAWLTAMGAILGNAVIFEPARNITSNAETNVCSKFGCWF